MVDRFARNQYAIAGMVFLVAVVARLLVANDIAGTPFFNIYVADSRNYHEWAFRLATGQADHGVFFQAPLYPYFLSILYRAFSPDPWVPRIAQAILAGIGCSLVSMSATRIFGRIAGWAAGLLAALYAPALFYDMLIHKAGITLFLGALIGFAITRFITAERTVLAALCIGSAVAIAALAIEHYLIVLPVVGVWMMMRTEVSWGQRFRWIGGLLVGMMLVQGPVVVRNYFIAGEPVAASTSMGLNFWIGNGTGATGHYRELRIGRGDIRFEQQDAEQIASMALGKPVSANEASRWWLNKALHDIANQPVAWLMLMVRKFELVIGDYEWPDGDAYQAYVSESPFLDALGHLLRFSTLFVLFTVGAMVAWSAKPAARLLIFVSVVILASVSFFYVFGRYRYAAVPLMLVLAGGGVALLEVRKKWKLVLPAGIMAGLASFIVIDSGLKNPAINYYAAGVEALNLNRLDDAMRMTLRSAELAPSAIQPHFGLATIYRRTQEWEKAEASLRLVIRLEPNIPDAYRLLGEALVGVGDIRAKRGDASGALTAYSEVLSMSSADEDDRRAARARIDSVLHTGLPRPAERPSGWHSRNSSQP